MCGKCLWHDVCARQALSMFAKNSLKLDQVQPMEAFDGGTVPSRTTERMP
jgi:hypothetical protein